jgi:hypothetical protein
MANSGATLGQVQTTFQLLTEETAIKWPFLYDSSQAIAGAYSWSAGSIMQHDGAADGMVIVCSTSSAKPLGVGMDSHNGTLDETDNSKATVIVNQHLAKTQAYNSTNITTSTVPGTALYPSATTAGNFDTISSAASSNPCAVLMHCDGTWLTYRWIGGYVV